MSETQEERDRRRQVDLLDVLRRVSLGCDPIDLPPKFCDMTLDSVREELWDIRTRLTDIAMRRLPQHLMMP